MKFAAALISFAIAAPAWALTTDDLQWDLTYRSVLNAEPTTEVEQMRQWVTRHPERPIHDGIASHSGGPVDAAVLIEMPDWNTGKPVAMWFVRTQTTAVSCNLSAAMPQRPCATLPARRVESLARELLDLKPAARPSGEHAPDTLNYLGFLSVFVDGRSLQRVISAAEFDEASDIFDPAAGQLARALEAVTLSQEKFDKRQAEWRAQALQRAMRAAARSGDLPEMARLLDRGARPEPAEADHAELTPLAVAAGSGQARAVDWLLQRGASLDAFESSALKAAVLAGDGPMVLHLLHKGARVDPPDPSRLDMSRRIQESALGVAVRMRDHAMARLLIGKGADVNIAQSQPIIAVAALARDLAMVELLLASGARPDHVAHAGDSTALIQFIRSGDDHPETETVVRRLVAAGADVNYTGRDCLTTHAAAGNEATRRLLLELGADPQLRHHCDVRSRQGESGSSNGAEVRVRHALMSQTNGYLKAGDYKSLETLYLQLRKGERTPSGIWKLVIYYNQLMNFAQPGRDRSRLDSMVQRVTQWEKQFPASVPARIFHAYVYWNRALAFRGSAPFTDLSREDRHETRVAANRASDILFGVRRAASTDPEWYRANLLVMPYVGLSAQRIEQEVERAMKLHAHYHEIYFQASFYMRPLWGGSNAAIDRMARNAAAAAAVKEGRALYARIYWYLDQAVYRGSLFTDTDVSWPDMKNGFDDLVARYPDPWNLNAYAYFACLAGDTVTANVLLGRIGDALVFSAWGHMGGAAYNACTRRIAQEGRKTAE